MGSYLSAEKSAATKTGESLEVWRAKRSRGERWCFRCRTWKSVKLFSIDRSRSQGRSASCRWCTSKASTASRYRMTPSELTALLERSGGTCELCGKRPEKLVVDHHHGSGKVRGVLCSGCNVGLGLFGDDPGALRLAAAYLEVRNG